MKAISIVRRIDDLGRVVIPTEIRKSLNLKEQDPLEILLDAEQACLVIKKCADK